VIDLPTWYLLLSAVFAAAVAANMHGYTLYQAITHPTEFLQAVMSSGVVHKSAFAQLSLVPPELMPAINLAITIIVAAIAFVVAVLIGIALKRVAMFVKSVFPKKR